MSVLEVMAYLAPDRIRIKEIFLELMVCDKAKLWDVFELLNKYPMIDLKGREASVHIPAGLKLQIEEICLKSVADGEKKLWDAVKLLDRSTMFFKFFESSLITTLIYNFVFLFN